MSHIDKLIMLITEQVKSCNDADLLDFIFKLLISESRN